MKAFMAHFTFYECRRQGKKESHSMDMFPK